MTFFPSHSYEQYYQAVRRCWRFGQTRPVVVDIVTTEGGRTALANLSARPTQADQMFTSLVAHMNDALAIERSRRIPTSSGGAGVAVLDQYITDRYALYNGDCMEVMPTLPDGSVHLSVYSPPFAGLYHYSSSERDLSNSRDYDEFFEHYGFVVGELARG